MKALGRALLRLQKRVGAQLPELKAELEVWAGYCACLQIKGLWPLRVGQCKSAGTLQRPH